MRARHLAGAVCDQSLIALRWRARTSGHVSINIAHRWSARTHLLLNVIDVKYRSVSFIAESTIN